jgi:ParB family transcriptional regulator, chromosome partitioning protein
MLDKLFAAFLRRADEGTLSRLLVEVSVLLASGRSSGSSALRDAAMTYKVDTDLIALKVKQEFAAKEKAKKSVRPESKPAAKARKAA